MHLFGHKNKFEGKICLKIIDNFRKYGHRKGGTLTILIFSDKMDIEKSKGSEATASGWYFVNSVI